MDAIEISPRSEYLLVGCWLYIESMCFPPKATNTDFIWKSSNPSVATVDNAGWLRAISGGEAIITATSTTGIVSNECKITVRKPKVTVKKDDFMNEIIFEDSGKVWKCINREIVYYYDYKDIENLDPIPNEIGERLAFNTYIYPEVPNSFQMRDYDIEELKVLYALDPHGVAAYIDRCARSADDMSSLEYRDMMYKKLFNRTPRHYIRNIYDQWIDVTGETQYLDREIFSESELIFGRDLLFDINTMISCCQFIFDSADSVLSKIPYVSTVWGTVKNFVKYTYIALNGGKQDIREAIDGEISDALFAIAFEEASMSWANDLITLLNDVGDIFNNLDVVPEYDKIAYKYCAEALDYDVFVELKNGKKYKMTEICSALDLL